ncbi:MAG: hypothetical protein SGPRY_010948 [Prymnesium sp.]
MPDRRLEAQFPLRTIELVSGAFFADSNSKKTDESEKHEEPASYPPPPPLTGGYSRVEEQARKGRPRNPAKAGFQPLR